MWKNHKQSIMWVLGKNPEIVSELQSSETRSEAKSRLSELSKVPEHLLTDNEIDRLLDKVI